MTLAIGASLNQMNAINPVDHLGLVRYLVMRVGIGPRLVDDSEEFADGCVGLIAACKHFDPARGAQFATYAAKVIFNNILSGRRKRSRSKKLPLCELTEDNSPAVMDRGPDRIDMKNLVDGLPWMDRVLLRRLYWENRTQQEVADKYGVCRQAITLRHKNALHRLRDLMHLSYEDRACQKPAP